MDYDYLSLFIGVLYFILLQNRSSEVRSSMSAQVIMPCEEEEAKCNNVTHCNNVGSYKSAATNSSSDFCGAGLHDSHSDACFHNNKCGKCCCSSTPGVVVTSSANGSDITSAVNHHNHASPSCGCTCSNREYSLRSCCNSGEVNGGTGNSNNICNGDQCHCVKRGRCGGAGSTITTATPTDTAVSVAQTSDLPPCHCFCCVYDACCCRDAVHHTELQGEINVTLAEEMDYASKKPKDDYCRHDKCAKMYSSSSVSSACHRQTKNKCCTVTSQDQQSASRTLSPSRSGTMSKKDVHLIFTSQEQAIKASFGHAQVCKTICMLSRYALSIG